MRVVFMGSPAFSVPVLDALVAAGHELVGVVTQPDRRRGRGKDLLPSPVKARALELGLPVFTPERIRREPELQARLGALGADVSVVVAFGQILPPEVLASSGGAPVGDTSTGMTYQPLESAADPHGAAAAPTAPNTAAPTSIGVTVAPSRASTNAASTAPPPSCDTPRIALAMPALSAIGSIASEDAIGAITMVIAFATTAQPNQSHTDGTPPSASTTSNIAIDTATCRLADQRNINREPKRSISRLLSTNARAMPAPDNPKNTVNCASRP